VTFKSNVINADWEPIGYLLRQPSSWVPVILFMALCHTRVAKILQFYERF
jgi:hypothetical protein